ncbi:hypothetical protein [Paracoccus sp. KR1-242]|uniref:hypothetical protein n=1 Tax=Paracoccus sp. KR1-242 TaxID=3410028 RepID=UPI003C09E472
MTLGVSSKFVLAVSALAAIGGVVHAPMALARGGFGGLRMGGMHMGGGHMGGMHMGGGHMGGGHMGDHMAGRMGGGPPHPGGGPHPAGGGGHPPHPPGPHPGPGPHPPGPGPGPHPGPAPHPPGPPPDGHHHHPPPPPGPYWPGYWDDDDDFLWGAATALAIGTMVRSAPSGCADVQVGNHIYKHCGDTWLQAAYSGHQLVYIAVEDPR